MIMSINKNKRNLLGITSVVFCVISCIPVWDTRVAVVFRNCTNDTLFIGVSHYDNIDSVDFMLFPHYNILANSNVDTTNVSLWQREFFENKKDFFVYPDSLCSISVPSLSCIPDTCYFFLIKYDDAKRYSWDEIRAKKLFRKWIVTKNAEGKFYNEIKY